MNFLKPEVILSAIIFFVGHTAHAQDRSFYYGADLSYVNQMEDCGADYKRDGVSVDPYKIFAGVGTNLVRVRLWVDPSWWQEPLDQPDGVKPYYSDLEDVKKTIERAKAEGMEVMLGFHYSDFWADPGRQLIPRAWLDAARNPVALADSVYHYTKHVLTELDSLGLMPEIVKVGNENNPGIMVHIPEEDGFNVADTVASNDDWERHAAIFNSGIAAVREVGQSAAINPKIALHWSNLNGMQWWYSNMMANGVTDFDIIGFSYYYAWHGGSIARLEDTVETMVQNLPDYDVMAVETGYLWSEEYGGIIDEPDPEFLPVIPEKQLEYMVDYARAVMRAGGTGVVFWEPAWVDTPCKTPWITGSSHTNVAFFDPVDTNFMEHGGGTWPDRSFYENPHAPKGTFKVDMSGVEVSGEGVYITGDFTGDEWKLQRMTDLGNNIYSFFTYLPEGSEGAFYFINGPDWDARETVPEECADMWDTDRAYSIPGEDTEIAFKWASCEPIYASNEVTATFRVNMADSGVNYSGGVYITGDVTGWEIVQMNADADELFSYQTTILPGEQGAYYYMTTDSWDEYQDYRETVPAECAQWYGSDRGYTTPYEDVEFGYHWGSCTEIGESTSVDVRNYLPKGFALEQNYPNPFNPSTTISYEVPEPARVNITVYNSLGQRVFVLVDENQPSGNHSVNFNASGLSSGLYKYRMVADRFSQTRAMTLIK